MSCLLTQSSSDGGSNAQSDTSMRTAYTVDANGRQINSIMKVFGKKHASQNSKPIVAHYIKKTGDIKMIGNGVQLNSRWNNFKQDSHMPECPPLLRSMRLSISAGDMRTMNIPKTRKTPLSMKKCFSCLTISTSAKEMPEFW
ncbi:g_PROTEIN_RECEP_F1_2 domain-containing protein [Trichonephila clavata]|uniref:G_PROTEIN_RECEP_F1_2 domain-containing protein n=1 Tax=Trichonephila clavata TaxID=2740835 RepID=A0A8X6I199_TRICU|nr:g_PROTEIN_RECEP_F1_2 domain-containing protein [Trichonephila clavata]